MEVQTHAVTGARRIPLDAANTRVAFAISWVGFLTVHGHFRELSGSLRLTDDDVRSATLTVDVVAASVSTGIAIRDRHLRGRRFLDVDRVPLISFKTGSVRRDDASLIVDGVLSLRGIERHITAAGSLGFPDANGAHELSWRGGLVLPRLRHDVGRARGLHVLNPLFAAIGREVRVEVALHVPAMTPASRPTPVRVR